MGWNSCKLGGYCGSCCTLILQTPACCVKLGKIIFNLLLFFLFILQTFEALCNFTIKSRNINTSVNSKEVEELV